MRFLGSLLLAFFLLIVPAVSQQGSQGTLNGTVKDPSGAVIAGAQVVATETSTRVVSRTVSTSSGFYTFPSLPPGTYSISAASAGFRPGEVTDVMLRVAQLLSVNLTLQVGGGVETVTVSTDEQLLETGTAQLSHYVTAKEIESWPIPVTADGQRQLQDFIFKSLPGTTGETFLGSINGGQYFSNEIYIEGITLGTFDTAELGPSIDAVGEFNLQSGSMGAQYNGGGTAVSNFNIHSGTNQFHGVLYEYFQNEDLNANSYDANTAAVPVKPKQRLNNFGGTVGGPIWIPKVYNGKDKSFFFVSLEKTLKRNFTQAGQTSLPIPAMLGGDLSAYLNPTLTNTNTSATNMSGQQAIDTGGNPVVDAIGRPVIYGQIYNPATTRTVIKGQPDPVTGIIATANDVVRDPFPNNQIPVGSFDKVAQNYLKLPLSPTYRNGNVVNNVNTYAGNQPVFNQTVFTIKLDQVITDKHKVSFYMTNSARDRSQSGAATWSLPGTTPLEPWDLQHTPGKIFRANEYWMVSPKLVNHFGVGYNRFTNEYTTHYYDQDWASTLGLSNLPTVGFPTVSFGGVAGALGAGIDTFGNGANGAGSIDQSTIFTDQLSLSRGSHQISFGTEWRFYNENDQNISGQPSFNFSNKSTADGELTDRYTGNSFASFLLGQVNSTGRTVYAGDFGFRRREVGNYVQDNWKVNSRLSLNLGLRWEVLTGINEVKGQMTSFDPNLPNTAAGNLPGALKFAGQLGKKGFENTNWGLILPRFGFAYIMNPKMVARGGFGVNTQAPEGGPQLQFQGNPSTLGYSGSLAVNLSTNPTGNNDVAPTTLSTPYPSYTAALPNYDPTQANGGTSSPPQFVRPDGTKVAYVENYSFGMQIDLGHETIAEVNYLGNTTKRLYAAGTDQLNQLPIGNLALGDTLIDPLSEHPEIATPYVGFDTSQFVQQALAPYPQFAGGEISQYDSHLGWSRYDSMQMTLTRHTSKGFSFLVAYTWAKTMTNTNTNCNSGLCGAVQDVHNLKLEKAVALNINVPQQLKITSVYDLPFGQGRLVRLPGPLDWVAGGWTLSGNTLYQSGNVLQVSDSGVTNGIFASTRPNYTGAKVKIDTHGPLTPVLGIGPQFLNPAAFASVPTSSKGVALTTGDVPSALGHDFGPGLAIESFSLQKNFSLGEKRYVQIRADAINAFNRAGRGNPDTDIASGTFGQLLAPGTDSQGQDGDSYFYQPRVVQLAARISF